MQGGPCPWPGVFLGWSGLGGHWGEILSSLPVFFCFAPHLSHQTVHFDDSSVAVLYLFARAAITKHRKPSALNK